jgi:thiamine pyrophosphate-dependent acetolactate synthase large subunit-like protein
MQKIKERRCLPCVRCGKRISPDIDQMDLYESITKWSRVCYETERIGEYVAMAFRHALSGRPAPVYLEIPQDILMGRVKKSDREG